MALDALHDLVDGLRTRDIAVTATLPSPGGLQLDRETERIVFQVAQECLRNAARHSHATSVSVTLTVRADGLVLDVVDDGVGFDVDAALSDPAEGHFGLRLLADAAEQHGASLEVASAPGAGTSWRLVVAR